MPKILLTREEVLARRRNILKIRYIAISSGLIGTFLLKIFLEVPFPNIFFGLLLFMLVSTFAYHYIVSRFTKLTVVQIANIYFVYMLFDLIIITIIIYLLGGITWFGFVFYALYIYLSFLFLPKSYIMLYVLYCIFLYTVMAVIQYWELLPTFELFSPAQRIPQNFTYVIANWLAAVLFLFLVEKFGEIFYDILANRISELEKIRNRLEEERASLEIRVRARTRQLSEEREMLAQKVEERTKELEKEKQELARKVNELQRFYKVAVGRELKIRELKKKLKQKENVSSN